MSTGFLAFFLSEAYDGQVNDSCFRFVIPCDMLNEIKRRMYHKGHNRQLV